MFYTPPSKIKAVLLKISGLNNASISNRPETGTLFRCKRIHVYTYMYTYIYICIFTCTLYIYIYLDIFTKKYVYMYLHTHIYIYMWISSEGRPQSFRKFKTFVWGPFCKIILFDLFPKHSKECRMAAGQGPISFRGRPFKVRHRSTQAWGKKNSTVQPAG